MNDLDPVAHLLSRAGAAASVVERHHCAFYSIEASLRLAVAARLAVWRQAEETADGEIARFLARLPRASLGSWLGGLRALDAQLDEGHALAGQLGRHDSAAWSDLAAACEAEGVVSSQVARTARRSVLGGLELAVAYRNAVLGHGVWREHTFYARLGASWLEVAVELHGALTKGDELAALPSGSITLGDLDLSPLVCWRAHPLLERVQVGFLDQVVLRGGQIRRTSYLDYASGEHFEGSASVDITALLAAIAPAEPEPEEADDVELLEVIGRGATATVHRAVQRSLGRQVAVKVLEADRSDDPIAAARFRREVQILASIDHPAVVRLLSAGEREGRPSFTMELVEGEDLAALGTRLGRPGNSRDGAASLGSESEPRWRLACRLFADVADGVHALHEAGGIHRDIKPANLLLPAGGGRLVLVDLGLARLSGDPDLTRHDGQLVGTLRYMAPEQLQRSLLDVDHRVDIYALCASLFELVTGRPPHDGETEAQLVQQVLQEQIAPARSLAPWLPMELDTVLAVGLARNPDGRFSTARELADDLRAVAEGRPISARPVSLFRRMSLGARRATIPLSLGAGALLMAAAVGLWQWDRTRLKVSYTTGVAVRNGAWVGVGPLSSDPGPTGFRVEARGGLVERIAWRPGWREAGPLPAMTFEPWPSSIEQRYDDEGRVTAIRWLGHTGEERWRADVEHTEDAILWRYRTARGMPMAGPSLALEPGELVGRWGSGGVYEIAWSLAEDGWPARAVYKGMGGESTTNDGQGIAGLAWERDAPGRPVAQSHLDLEGSPSQNPTLPPTWTLEYGDGWRAIRISSEPIQGIAADARRYDGAGRIVWRKWTDSEGAVVAMPAVPLSPEQRLDDDMALPAAPWLKGCGEIAYTWDNAGELSGQHCVTPVQRRLEAVNYQWDDGLPTRMMPTPPPPAGGHALTWQDGMVVASRNVDDAGETIHQPGYPSGVRILRDERGWPTAAWHEDRGGAPFPGPSGALKVAFRHDGDGNPTEMAWLGRDEEPAVSGQGVHRILHDYDAMGRQIRIRALDTDGKPTTAIDDGIVPAVTEMDYDDRGRMIARRIFDADGVPFIGAEGHAQLRRVYTDSGQIDTNYDTSGRPIRGPNGCISTANRFEHGLLTEAWCLDENGEPDLMLDGFFKEVRIYDSSGRETSRQRQDRDGNPASDWTGTHRMDFGYDNRGRLVSFHEKNVDGGPVPGFRERHTGQVVSDVDYELTVSGRVANLVHLTLEGEPAVRLEWTYDGWNRIATFERIPRGTPLFPHLQRRLEYAYGADDGRIIEITAYPVTGEPYKLRMEYDALGATSAMEMVDLDGNPTLGRIAGLFYAEPPKRDHPISYGMSLDIPFGRVLGLRDPLGATFGRLEMRSEGVAGELDRLLDTPSRSRTKVREVAWFGADREPIEVEGIHRRELQWAETDQIASIRTYGRHGQPVASEEGAFHAEWINDAEGRFVGFELRGPDGELTDHPVHGYATEDHSFGEHGLVRVYQTAVDGTVVYSQEFAYDDRGRMTRMRENSSAQLMMTVDWQEDNEARIRFYRGPEHDEGTIDVHARGQQWKVEEVRIGPQGTSIYPAGGEPFAVAPADLAFLGAYFKGTADPFQRVRDFTE